MSHRPRQRVNAAANRGLASPLGRAAGDSSDRCANQSGRLIVERTSGDPMRIAEDAVAKVRPQAEAKKLSLQLYFNGEIPHRIRTDPRRLQRALERLLENAVRFTETGSVTMLVSADDTNGGTRRMRFLVRDTGLGLTNEQLAEARRLSTTPVRDAPAADSRNGFALSYEEAEKLKGSLEVESKHGHGTMVTLTIEAACPSTSASGALCGTTILIVEDMPTNQRAYRLVLAGEGAGVEIAENGRAGVEKALAALSEKRPYSLVLMDMQMPVLDGYAATRQLRYAGYIGPIIALTGHAGPEDRQMCLAAGCNEYLAKPVDRMELIHTCQSWTARRDP